ncbi:hypothetical protein VINI7043_11771 [Vibrio nigripulchritudo ATCC 27043]|uniref:reprolysin-like metallopeptidase n=1 Tax=Vibrio nigripulchritudo TaxID=28173 RepID=UPI00021C2385|nr:zinc-dependent metalloprotease family protein [Vibrio nigripulchritudo]EGU50553.1 hypothetical protein VINI7043_11771 [Vibrio nigripulchritudo ATCC 27043]
MKKNMNRWINVCFALSATALGVSQAIAANDVHSVVLEKEYINQPSSAQFWLETVEHSSASEADRQRYIKPAKFRLIQLELDQLKYHLNQTVTASTDLVNERAASVDLSIPLPNGGYETFVVAPNQVLPAELAARYPGIKTFSGTSAETNNTRIVLDYTLQGFHAMVTSEKYGTFYIDPYESGNTRTYISYFKKDYHKTKDLRLIEETLTHSDSQLNNAPSFRSGRSGFGTSDMYPLRTYRLAIATTYEYSRFHGGTKQSVMSAVATTINRVNEIYERDLAIRLQLIPTTDQLFSLDVNDYYTNNRSDLMQGESQIVIDNVIGQQGYDVGHLFSATGGGSALIGSVCTRGKGSGVSGLGMPMGDAFDIDIVAHEIGHQFGAEHTHNTGCNRVSYNAVEPGSGSTIMGYAGVCGPNVQVNSDAMFHSYSIGNVRHFMDRGYGSGCGTSEMSLNTPPVVRAGPDVTIPKETPFVLTGSAADTEDQASLTYSWEQIDRGDLVARPTANQVTGPTFRAKLPTVSPTRYLPNLDAIINNQTPTWEVLSSVARSYKFRLVARDNNTESPQVSWDERVITVDGTAGPFLVSEPNTKINWLPGSTQTVRWQVAGTHLPPVSVSLVNILLSLDGGKTYPHTLAKNSPNTGKAEVVLPNSISNTARIKVEAVDNIFFDISNVDFSISEGIGLNQAPEFTSVAPVNATSGTAYHYQVSAKDVDSPEIRFRAKTKPAWLSFDASTLVLSGTPTDADIGSHQVVLQVSDSQIVTSQTFQITVTGSATQTCGTVEPWSASQVYVTGDQVSYGNKTFEARWWTKGQQPDASKVDGDWKLIDPCQP